ncbi:MAG: hypothetical protein K2L10_05060 [Ruminococcus sp.]|nr:hypothetical protein [Ruminococcus sp.]
MTKKYCFVDYDNVHQAGLNGIDKMSENDKVMIFYTPNNETLTFGMYKKMTRCKADIELYRIQSTAKSVLNFQLCTLLGYTVGNSPETEYYIISNDLSYEYIMNFWKDKNIDVRMSPNIMKILQQQVVSTAPVNTPAENTEQAETVSNNAEPPETDFEMVLKKLHLSEEDIAVLHNIINNGKRMYSSSDCLYIKGEITRKFSIDVYNAIRPYI